MRLSLLSLAYENLLGKDLHSQVQFHSKNFKTNQVLFYSIDRSLRDLKSSSYCHLRELWYLLLTQYNSLHGIMVEPHQS